MTRQTRFTQCQTLLNRCWTALKDDRECIEGLLRCIRRSFLQAKLLRSLPQRRWSPFQSQVVVRRDITVTSLWHHCDITVTSLWALWDFQSLNMCGYSFTRAIKCSFKTGSPFETDSWMVAKADCHCAGTVLFCVIIHDLHRKHSRNQQGLLCFCLVMSSEHIDRADQDTKLMLRSLRELTIQRIRPNQQL